MEGLFNGTRFPGGLDAMVLMILDIIIRFLLDYTFGCFLSWV